MEPKDHIEKELKAEWIGRATFISESYEKSVDDFNQKLIPKLEGIVNNQEQARLAARILLSKVEIKYKDLSFREADPVGVSSGAYDHHLYPTYYDLDDIAYTIAIGINDNEAMALVNNPEELKQLIKSISG